MLPASALNLRGMVLGVGGSRAIAIGQTVSRLIVLVGVLLLVGGLSDIKRVPILEAVAALVYGLVILVLVGRRLRLSLPLPRANLRVWRSTLEQSFPLMLTGLARASIISFDVLIIDLMLGPHKLGIYAVASKPVFLLAGVTGLFSMAFLSAFSATSGGHAAVLKRRSLRWSFGAGLVMAAIVSLSSPLLPLVFGEEYESAVPVLAVMAWRIPVGVLAGVYASTLIARHRQMEVMRNSFIVATFVVAADVVAVVALGIMGAAIVSVAGGVLSAYIYSRSVARLEPDLASARPTITERSTAQ
jgi:O-antigen/teichoic acid export membrane protein